MAKIICVLGLLTAILIMLTYVAIKNHNYKHIIRQSTSKRFDAAIDERVKEWMERKSNRRQSQKSGNIRHRLVNDLGIVVADEQPDFNELNAVSNSNKDDSVVGKLALNDRRNRATPVTVLSSIIEHDPTIDENAVPLSYKYYADSRERLA